MLAERQRAAAAKKSLAAISPRQYCEREMLMSRDDIGQLVGRHADDMQHDTLQCVLASLLQHSREAVDESDYDDARVSMMHEAFRRELKARDSRQLRVRARAC